METVLANNTVLYPSAFHPTVNTVSSLLLFLSARADGRLCTTKFFLKSNSYLKKKKKTLKSPG